jgi:acetylornithine/succinyldiaminopimelate/putrescine aminotransferase
VTEPVPAGLDYFGFASKEEFLDQTAAVWNPDKVRFWREQGTELVMDRREGYYVYDTSGKRLIDVHINGGTFNLGHRNPELTEALEFAMQMVDMGNHHFPALARTALANALLATCHAGMSKVVYGASGGEANDIAIKSARYATRRKKIVSIHRAYHGNTGLSLGATDERFSERFLSGRPDEFEHVRFNDIEAMEQALAGRDVAAVIMETIPATYGFPMPLPGYLAEVKRLCERYGSIYIADEVQTGLMRTGEMWAIYGYGVEPDILVTAKGISGGLYPLSAVVLSERCGRWLEEDGWGHISTGAGSELGCVVGLKVLEITQRPAVRTMVKGASERFARGLARIASQQPDWFIGLRQNGLIMGLEFNHPEGAKLVSSELYKNGVWAIFATLDTRVLQFKPGLLVSPDDCDDLLDRTAVAIAAARERAG